VKIPADTLLLLRRDLYNLSLQPLVLGNIAKNSREVRPILGFAASQAHREDTSILALGLDLSADADEVVSPVSRYRLR
jgi:hypothetical protein